MKFCLGYYRYGFNGKEKDVDGEWGEHTTAYDYGFRIYNPSIGKFLSVDPQSKNVAAESPFGYAGNSPTGLIDVAGRFKFDPKTLAIMKRDYPRAYSYFVNTDNLLKYVTNEKVMRAVITNSRYFQGQKVVNAMKQGRTRTGSMEALGAYDGVDPKQYQLTKRKVEKAFTYGEGQEIVIVSKPGGFETAAGYNPANSGFDYKDSQNRPVPIQLSESAFKALESATSVKEQQAALISIISTITHEFLENFGGDQDDFGNGEFGAYPAQGQIFGNIAPGIHGNEFIQEDMENGLRALENLERDNPEIVPIVDNSDKE